MSTYVIGKDKRDPNGEVYEAPLWNGWYVFVDSTTQLLDSIYTEEEDLMSRVDLFINPNYEDGTMYFNGNDAITLETASGDILDIIGKIGEDPGDGWGPVENGSPWTQNHTLIRKSDVTSGFVSNPAQSFSFDPTLEWDSLPQNTFINLGTHSCDCSNIIETFGCTQETAFNYNSDANIDDGSCIWIDPTMDCGPSIQEVYFPLYLPQGWGMFGFTCTNSMDLFDAFQSIVDQVLIVKDAEGSAYLPEYGFNGIGDLIYSRGYQIKTTEEILDFSFCTTLIVSEGPVEGCMDETAFNYNPEAMNDDGSCITQITQENIHDAVDAWLEDSLATEAIYGHISDWDVSNVTDMGAMFYGTSFNNDLSSWDVSNVTNMNAMFAFDSSFNGDLSSWDVSSVIDMSYMFRDATSFNGDISYWDVSNVTDMNAMFYGATSLSEENQCAIQESFSSNSNWEYEWCQ